MQFTERDKRCMELCLKLARKGAGHVSPNPMVGAVITKNGKVVGTGYHRTFGGPHAEVHAIRAAGKNVRGATLYVNLEPCNFFGKTPPCTDLIISSGISRVVIGMSDPNPRVRGKGVRQLRRAGILVIPGVLAEECRSLNEAFVKYITTGLPFVTLKIAQTLDGKIADHSGNSKWITGKPARRFVHKLRSQADAVLVGAQTVQFDNPRLTVRYVRGRNPVRIVLDGRCSSRPDSHVYSPTGTTRRILVVSRQDVRRKPQFRSAISSRGVEILELPSASNGKISVRTLLQRLGREGIASIMVEGGAATFSAFLKTGLADKVMIFVAPRLMNKGLQAFSLPASAKSHLERIIVDRFGNDVMICGYLHYSGIRSI